MKNLITLLLVCLCSLPLVAQSDKQIWKELDQWGKNADRRRYPQGEEIKVMIREAERRDAAPLTRPRGATITNADILRMKTAGFADGTIINAIETRAGWFDTSAEALIYLNRAGISETVINSILQAERENSNKLIPTDKHGLPSEIGIYVVQPEGYTEIDAEPISWKDGGVWKSIVSFGFTRGHINAKAMNSRSRYAVARNTDVILRTPEGVAASEYLLVQLYEKDNRREFRFITGGVVHRSSGAERTAVSFSYIKIAPRTYAVNVGNLASGEYGFLPTFQTNNTSAAFVGKLYSFSID